MGARVFLPKQAELLSSGLGIRRCQILGRSPFHTLNHQIDFGNIILRFKVFC